jgi:uncharacterized protein YacL
MGLRIGVFAVILGVLLAFQLDPLFAALIAAVASLAISLLFFQKQRDALSAQIYERVQNRAKFGEKDVDSDIENAIIDSTEIDNGEIPAK